MTEISRKLAIKLRMQRLRTELDQIAIRRGDLEHEYRELNKELGRIELSESVATEPRRQPTEENTHG